MVIEMMTMLTSCILVVNITILNYAMLEKRGHSSAGRAFGWQRRGRGFEPPWLHHLDV